jgi:hypothetical protein
MHTAIDDRFSVSSHTTRPLHEYSERIRTVTGTATARAASGLVLQLLHFGLGLLGSRSGQHQIVFDGLDGKDVSPT